MPVLLVTEVTVMFAYLVVGWKADADGCYRLCNKETVQTESGLMEKKKQTVACNKRSTVSILCVSLWCKIG